MPETELIRLGYARDMQTPIRFVLRTGFTLTALALLLSVTGCASAPDADCVHACDVDWDACTMASDRELDVCEAGCGDRPACLDRCERAHPMERARCDDRHNTCASTCGGG